MWVGGAASAAARRAGKRFDGWIPTAPTAEAFAESWSWVKDAAEEAGRNADDITPAVYLSVNLNEDANKGETEAKEYAEAYYGLPFDVMRSAQAYFIGDPDGCNRWLQEFIDAGARHLVLRFATLDDPLPQLDVAAKQLIRAGNR